MGGAMLRRVIVDARGNERAAYAGDTPLGRLRDRPHFPREDFRRVRASLASPTWGGRHRDAWWMVALQLGLWFVAAAIVGGTLLFSRHWRFGVVGGAFFSWGAWFVLTARTRLQERDAGVRAGALLAARRCASCAYSLGGATASDGCTVCPECGAAWRLP